MITRRVFRSGSLVGETLAPGLYRIRKETPESGEVLTLNANTDHVLWEEIPRNPVPPQEKPAITIGLTTPFHLFRREELEAEPEFDDQFETLDTRVRELLKEGGDFLASHAVHIGADSVTREKFKRFVSDLETRGRVNPRSVKPGDCVAILVGTPEKRRIFLARVLQTGEMDSTRYMTYEGMDIERDPSGHLRFTYSPKREGGGYSRPVFDDDQIVSIKPDELRQFYIPDARERTESVEYFERLNIESAAIPREEQELLQQFMSRKFQQKRLVSLGSVSV